MVESRKLYRVRYHGPDFEDTRLLYIFFRATCAQDAVEMAKGHLRHLNLQRKQIFIHCSLENNDFIKEQTGDASPENEVRQGEAM